MNVVITGGAGFLGARLARRLLKDGSIGVAGESGRQIDRLTLTDRVDPPADLTTDPRVRVVGGDLYELLDTSDAAGLREADLVFHLAAAVSGESEADFDLGLRANLLTTTRLLEVLRSAGRVAELVFSSSLAVYGKTPGMPLPSVVEDRTLPLPQTSYGSQKLACEYLIADYSRKGFLRARTARLMTVSVRAGAPNAAASGFMSGIIREPLAGLRATCPVDRETAVALASPATTVDGLVKMAAISDSEWGGRVSLNIPALTVTIAEMVAALERAAGGSAVQLIDWVPDPAVAAMVSGWPARFDNSAARNLGLPSDESFDSIVAAYRREIGSVTTL